MEDKPATNSTPNYQTLNLEWPTSNLFTKLENSNWNSYYWQWWPDYQQYYTLNYQVRTSPDRYEAAFKIAKKLTEAKVISTDKVVDFFKLMDLIVSEL